MARVEVEKNVEGSREVISLDTLRTFCSDGGRISVEKVDRFIQISPDTLRILAKPQAKSEELTDPDPFPPAV